MLKEFKIFVEKHNLIEKDDKILLALSGGVDSMVLARLFLRLQDYKTTRLQANSQSSTAKFQSSKFNIQLAFAHCNFHLRGEDSNRDENFVRQFAEENDIHIFIKHFDTETYAKENSLSIEMAARELRYAWFKELKETHGFTKVALAHHGDDQIETFFINMLRGSGIKGLKGMKPQNDFYIRPLLWSDRDVIETFAKENDIQWVEDYTNQETIYLRNKIRHQIVPLFDEIKTNARKNLNFSINCLSSENELYRELIDDKLSEIEFVDGDYRSIDVKYFLQNENGKQFLFEWVRKYGFNYEQAESMYEAMQEGKSGVLFYSLVKTMCTSFEKIVEMYTSSVQKDKIEIFRNGEEIEEYWISGFPDFRISRISEFQNSGVPKLRFSVLNKDENFKMIKNPSAVAQFDMDKISFPLKLRHWKKGDRFKPIGMKGSKLLSDFFNDLGFSTYQKQKIWIMEGSNGLILWVVGYRISDKAKITDSTKVIFQCDLER